MVTISTAVSTMSSPALTRASTRPPSGLGRRIALPVIVALALAAPVGLVPTTGWAQQDLRPVVADMQVRLTQLEELVRSLTGQLEKADFRDRQLEQKLDLLQRDMDLRLRELEGTGGASAPGASTSTSTSTSTPTPPRPPSEEGLAPDSGVLGYLPSPQAESAPGGGFMPPSAAAAPQGAVALPPGPPEEQYSFAFSLLRQGDYGRAERAFAAFIQAHPSHSLAGNAQYWLGETHYARGDYENAAVAFAKGFKDYASGSKTPDNLFKLGMSMSALGKKREACAAFQKLRGDYPDVAGTLQRQVTDQMRRNGC